MLYRYIYFAISSFNDYGQFSEVETSIVLSKTILTIEIYYIHNLHNFLWYHQMSW